MPTITIQDIYTALKAQAKKQGVYHSHFKLTKRGEIISHLPYYTALGIFSSLISQLYSQEAQEDNITHYTDKGGFSILTHNPSKMGTGKKSFSASIY